MTISDKLKLICNYEEKSINSNKVSLPYIDFITEDDIEYINLIKSQRRDLLIDITLGDKDESEWYDRLDDIIPMGGLVITAPQISTLNMNSNLYNDQIEIYDDVIKFLDKNTTQPTPQNVGLSTLNLCKSTLPTDGSRYRRIVTKIIQCSNMIAHQGRIGPGTSVIFGKNNIELMEEIIPHIGSNSLGGLEILVDENIDPDKIIVCRGNKIDSAGLIVIEDSTNKQFFMKGTLTWYKQYCWFWITP